MVNRKMNWIDNLPTSMLIIAAVALGLSPFLPEPHLWEKLKMLADGTLTRPTDIIDLLFHGAPILLLLLKGLRAASLKRTPNT